MNLTLLLTLFFSIFNFYLLYTSLPLFPKNTEPQNLQIFVLSIFYQQFLTFDKNFLRVLITKSPVFSDFMQQLIPKFHFYCKSLITNTTSKGYFFETFM